MAKFRIWQPILFGGLNQTSPPTIKSKIMKIKSYFNFNEINSANIANGYVGNFVHQI